MLGVAVAAAIALLLGATPAVADERPQAQSVTRVKADHPGPVTTPEEEAALVEAQETGQPVVVDAWTTQTNQVVALPDGSFQLTIDTAPVRVEKDGTWVPVDSTLEFIGGYWVPRATTVPVRFTDGGSSELAQVQLSDGSWLTETWALGVLPAPVIGGATAIYEEVLPGVDLRLSAVPTGMSEVLVVKTPEAAANPDLLSLEIGIEGATVTTKDNGTLSAAPEGRSALPTDLISTAPVLWDSTHGGSGAEGPAPQTAPVAIPVESSSEGISLDVGAALENEEIVYPLYVDPDWTGGRFTSWWINETYPNQSYPENGTYSGGNQSVGFVQGAWSADGLNQRARAFWHMNTSAVSGKTVISAVFNTTEVWASSCSARPVELWRVSNVLAGATWNQSLGLTWHSPALDTKNVAAGYSSSCPATAVGFNATTAAQWSANNNQSSIILALKASNESDTYSWKKFAYDAQLIINYNTKPTTPDRLTFAAPPRACTSEANKVYVPGTLPITFRAIVNDPDGANVVGSFLIEKKSGSSWVTHSSVASASQASGFHTATKSSLPVGSYRWSVTASDGSLTSDRSAYCYFDVDNTAPAAPQLTAVGDPMVGEPVRVSVTSTGPDQAEIYMYWMSPNAPVTSPTIPVLPSSVGVCDRSGSGNLRFACAEPGTVITVAPLEITSTLYVVTVDSAGLYSPAASQGFMAVPSSGVSPSAGHRWSFVDGLSSEIVTGDNGVDLDLGPTVKRTDTETINSGDPHEVATYDGKLAISEYWLDGKRKEFVGVEAGHGYVYASTAGWILPPAGSTPSGTSPLYKCVHSSGEDYLTRTSCSGGTIVGYTWNASSRPANFPTDDLRSCVSGSDRWVEIASCPANTTNQGSLGYVATDVISQTSGVVVDTTRSFTVSVWVKSTGAGTATAISQGGPENSAFTLGQANGKWRFCMTDQRITAERVCASSGATVGSGWTLLTGRWDAANQQVQLYVGDGLDPAGIAWRLSDPFADAPSTNGLILGSAVVGGAPVESWKGQISNPLIYQGVADDTQRDAFRDEAAIQ